LRLGIRGKLFLITVLAILAVELAAGVYLQRELRISLEHQVEAELIRHVRSVRDIVELTDVAWVAAEVDPIADRLGESTATRVTVIDADGRVIGDSQLPASELSLADDHSKRPEVVAARAEGVGTSRRHSATVDTDMLYVAVPFDGRRADGFVRVATPLREVDAAVGRLRLLLVFAGLLALGVAALVGGLLSHFVSRTLRDLVVATRTMAEGGARRLEVRSSDEISGLAGSINRMAEDLEKTVSALAEERNRFETVLESMDEAVLALDGDTHVTTVNRAARTLLGLGPEITGRSLIEVVRIPELTDLVERARAGAATSIEFELMDHGRKRVLARATSQSGGGIVLVMHDVTEIRRLETVRRDFVANVSHELRTPVSIIRANAETLLDGALERPREARRFLEATLRHADRLGRLVADLLDISRIEAGKYQIEAAPVRVAPVVRRVFEAVEARAHAKNMRLSVQAEEGDEALVDAKAFEQVLLNLVDNAVKYTPDGGSVTVRVLRKPPNLRVEVVDDGPGIEPVHRARIFERFYRIDPGRSREMGGTGLGLAIVRHLVEAMSGQVGVDGRLPHGSVFWLALPAPRTAAPGAPEAAP
jgi:two-component system phosphate regulon sensor histidine kinase PhoR